MNNEYIDLIVDNIIKEIEKNIIPKEILKTELNKNYFEDKIKSLKTLMESD
jgi:RNA-binding protein YhbY